MTTPLRIDNASDQVVYTGQWNPQFGDSAASNNTLTLTREAGSSATVTFTGTRISVFGVLGKMDPPVVPHITTYDLDDLPSETFAPSPPANPPLKQLMFWESPVLEDGHHKLTMTNSLEGAWIWFDYFEVTMSQALAPPSTPSPAASASVSSSPKLNSNSSTGMIVGASLGGVVAALLITGLVLFILWRRRKRSHHDDHPSPEGTDTDYRPAYNRHTDLSYASTVTSPQYTVNNNGSMATVNPDGANQLWRPMISGTILPSKARRDLGPAQDQNRGLPVYSEY